jgi:DNA polymerase V
MKAKVKAILTPDTSTKLAQPIFTAKVSAGFPSPAGDYEENRLDLNKHLVRNPPATFFVRVAGDSMVGAGIHPDDILVVDRSLEPKDGNVIIAAADGQTHSHPPEKALSRTGKRELLRPRNPFRQRL